MGNLDSTPYMTASNLFGNFSFPCSHSRDRVVFPGVSAGSWEGGLRGAGHREMETGFLCLQSRLRAQSLLPQVALWPFLHGRLLPTGGACWQGTPSLPGPCGPGTGRRRCLCIQHQGWGGVGGISHRDSPPCSLLSDCRSGVPWVPVAGLLQRKDPGRAPWPWHCLLLPKVQVHCSLGSLLEPCGTGPESEQERRLLMASVKYSRASSAVLPLCLPVEAHFKARHCGSRPRASSARRGDK